MKVKPKIFKSDEEWEAFETGRPAPDKKQLVTLILSTLALSAASTGALIWYAIYKGVI